MVFMRNQIQNSDECTLIHTYTYTHTYHFKTCLQCQTILYFEHSKIENIYLKKNGTNKFNEYELNPPDNLYSIVVIHLFIAAATTITFSRTGASMGNNSEHI